MVISGLLAQWVLGVLFALYAYIVFKQMVWITDKVVALIDRQEARARQKILDRQERSD